MFQQLWSQVLSISFSGLNETMLQATAQTKVTQLAGEMVLTQEHVGRLDVQVAQLIVMQVLQSLQSMHISHGSHTHFIIP